jgi:hypothetical protein
MKWIFPDCDHGINTCRHELLTRDREKRRNIVIYLQCYQYLQAWTVNTNVGSLRTAGHTDTGQLPLGNHATKGQSVALIQGQQSDNYLPSWLTISSKTLF